jgi:hypothetical protein
LLVVAPSGACVTGGRGYGGVVVIGLVVVEGVITTEGVLLGWFVAFGEEGVFAVVGFTMLMTAL